MTQTKPIISIENVVASASVDQAIDLADVTKKFPDTEWHPDQFPGLVFRLTITKNSHFNFPFRKNGLYWWKIGGNVNKGCSYSCTKTT